MMQLSEVANACNGQLLQGDCTFESISTDSRMLQSGDLFVALSGENFDGQSFAQVAANQGAAGLVLREPVASLDLPQLIVDDTLKTLGCIGKLQRHRFHGSVVAITGSCGKTTVKGMLREVLACSGSVVATQGNYNNQIGVPLTLMRLRSQDFAVVELGTSFPGEIVYLTGLVEPHVTLVNNVAPAHIGGFGSVQAIAQEKGAIYQAGDPSGVAIINLDGDFAAQFTEQTQDRRRIGFTRSPNRAHGLDEIVYAANECLNDSGEPKFELVYAQARHPVQLRVSGLFNVSNALAAASCALAVGSTIADVAKGLQNYTGDKGRMQLRTALCGARVIDDTYNANPTAVKAAIDLLSRYKSETFLVLGNMAELGESAQWAHTDIGAYAAERGIAAVYTWGGEAALAARAFGGNGYAFTEKKDLVAHLRPRLHKDAVVLVKGSRSARMEQIVVQLCEDGEAGC